MSAVLDNLENLDNKALREKCLEYGLPNIPITDTSKKLLIRRLRAAMEGGQKPEEKPKSRRETIHVIKVETETTKQIVTQKGTPTKAKPVSRKTIGTPNLPEEVEPPARAVVTQRRRSGRSTPISQLEPVESFKRKASDIIKEDEEDVAQIPVIVEKSSAEPARQTRAPSLSKSIVVTTSYVKDVPREIIELDDTEPEEELEEEEEEEDELEPQAEQVIDPIRYKYLSSPRNYDTIKPSSPSLEKGPYMMYSSAALSQPSSRILLSKAPTSASSYESSAARRYTTAGYKTSDGNENRTFMHHSDIEDNKDDQLDTPFLSDFARRLSRLKPDATNPALSTPGKGEKESHYYVSSVSARRSIAQNGSVSDSFYKLVAALNRKYHLKRNLTIFAFILIVVLIYVFFF